MKEKHPGLPTIRAISVLYMIICAVGSRFYPVDPVYFFLVVSRDQPSPTWMDRINRMKREETTNLRNYENSERHKNAFVLPILSIHVSYFACLIFAVFLFFPRFRERLRFDAERIGHAVDIVEKADDLDGVVDGAVVKAVLAKPVDVRGR